MSLLRLSLFLIVMAICNVQTLNANNTAEFPLRLLVLGDSLSAGYGLKPEDSFPSRLEEALDVAGYRVHVINAGVSGDTTAGGLSRLEWALVDKPHIVLVELGGNDALRGLPPAETYANLESIIVKLKKNGVRVVLAGMQAPRNLGKDYTLKFDAIYPRLAGQYDVPLYPFFLDGVALDPALNQPDGIHPNPAGVKVIVKKILPLLESELQQLNPEN
ncbi:MAG: arylesterase [Deltaproteobacteria bacterium]|jgi:acyl-CoA thioesterase-1|nr:arylesterase [Deltaproteobacteria bacterium]MDH4008577.1 arylesterase [Desulfuromonadales bacterium]